jgi:hypothetical protein
MVVKLFNALFFGAIFVLLLDFLIFVGLKLNYFDYYGIDIYFNTLFVDNQQWLFLFIAAIMLGYAMLYLRGNIYFDRIYILLVLLSALTFYPPIGKALGERLFMQKDRKVTLLGKPIRVDILYLGRDRIYLKKHGAGVAAGYRYDEVKL